MMVDFENILDASDELREQIRRWRNSTSVSQYMLTNHTISPEEHSKWIAHLRTTTTAKAWVIRADGNPVGLVSLNNIDVEEHTAEWGMYLADPSVRGKGVGSAVLYQLLEYAFNTLHLRLISTSVLDNNPTAVHLYEKFGFRVDPAKKQSLVREGKTIGVMTMALSRDLWAQTKQSLQEEITQKETAPLS